MGEWTKKKPEPAAPGAAHPAEPGSNRTSVPAAERIAATILRAVQQVLQRGLNDPRMEGALVTILSIDLAQDGRDATLRVSVLPATAENRVIKAVQHAGPFIRREAGELIRMRSLPQLHFVLDRSMKRQAEVMKAIGQAVQRGEQSAHPDADPSSP
jgi:ribosome-binding factor A